MCKVAILGNFRNIRYWAIIQWQVTARQSARFRLSPSARVLFSFSSFLFVEALGWNHTDLSKLHATKGQDMYSWSPIQSSSAVSCLSLSNSMKNNVVILWASSVQRETLYVIPAVLFRHSGPGMCCSILFSFISASHPQTWFAPDRQAGCDTATSVSVILEPSEKTSVFGFSGKCHKRIAFFVFVSKKC